jgi:hypothetical protein
MLDEGALMAQEIHILNHYTQQLQRQIVDQVKVQWDNYSPNLTT